MPTPTHDIYISTQQGGIDIIQVDLSSEGIDGEDRYLCRSLYSNGSTLSSYTQTAGTSFTADLPWIARHFRLITIGEYQYYGVALLVHSAGGGRKVSQYNSSFLKTAI